MAFSVEFTGIWQWHFTLEENELTFFFGAKNVKDISITSLKQVQVFFFPQLIKWLLEIKLLSQNNVKEFQNEPF